MLEGSREDRGAFARGISVAFRRVYQACKVRNVNLLFVSVSRASIAD